MEPREVQAVLTVFGSEPAEAQAWIHPRSDRWRVLGAAKWGLGGLVTAPVVVLVPPHVPWALGALATGGFMAWRKLSERITLVRVRGTCPRCHGPISVAKPSRLRHPHMLSCEGCQHEVTLSLREDVPPR
jgi:hypothetical protein